MAPTDDETPWTRHLLVAVAAVAVVALVIGGVVSVFALGAVRVAGLGDSAPTATARPSLSIPSGVPTTTVERFPDPEQASGSPAPARPGGGQDRPPRRPQPALTLQATPAQVGPGERITLAGRYRGPDGASLQVQRFSGGWVDFPVQATVRSGRYSTYIMTTRTGVNRLRMLDVASGTASRPVRVTVG
ncbi:MAG TPA: hypothetical protein VER39_08595 [Nocardioidaceae bacterium]|nr:hypothetical protein [Nocardioidaceae bacterium]